MMRDDLLQISESALIDVTSRGAVRRATKEVNDPDFSASFTGDAEALLVTMGTVTVRLPAISALNSAECSCPARSRCRHIASAVLAYQQHIAATNPLKETTKKPEEQQNSATTIPSSEIPSLARVTHTDHVSVVHLLHPTPAAIRFHAGLDEAICSCRASSCSHRDLARTLLTSTPDIFGFVTTGDDLWQPSMSVLAAARSALHRLLDRGLEGGRESIEPLFDLTAARLDEAQMPYLADLLREIIVLAALYSGRRAAFHPSALLDVLGEIFVRIAALENPGLPLPHRVVAGTSGPLVGVGRTTWLGLGTEVTPLVEGSRWTAYLLDEASGSVVQLTRDVSAGEPAPRVNGVVVPRWGDGRVVVTSARIGPHQDLRPLRGRVLRSRSTLPKAPYRATASLTDIAAELSSVPSVLDQRPATASLQVATHLKCVLHEDRSPLLVDGKGNHVDITWPTTMPPAQIRTAMEFITSADDVTVSGRWSMSSEGLCVVPLLLVSGEDILQPMVPGHATDINATVANTHLRGTALLLADLDDALGEVILAGMNRVRKDLRPWQELHARSTNHGSEHVAALSQELTHEGRNELVEELVIFRVIASTLDQRTMP